MNDVRRVPFIIRTRNPWQRTATFPHRMSRTASFSRVRPGSVVHSWHGRPPCRATRRYSTRREERTPGSEVSYSTDKASKQEHTFRNISTTTMYGTTVVLFNLNQTQCAWVISRCPNPTKNGKVTFYLCQAKCFSLQKVCDDNR